MASGEGNTMMQSEAITCPSCGSEEINMVSDPIVSHLPSNHGWCGQCHTVRVAMMCDHCSQDFVFEVSAYKNRASITCNVVEQ